MGLFNNDSEPQQSVIAEASTKEKGSFWSGLKETIFGDQSILQSAMDIGQGLGYLNPTVGNIPINYTTPGSGGGTTPPPPPPEKDNLPLYLGIGGGVFVLLIVVILLTKK